jgi:hypothetical protein
LTAWMHQPRLHTTAAGEGVVQGGRAAEADSAGCAKARGIGEAEAEAECDVRGGRG